MGEEDGLSIMFRHVNVRDQKKVESKMEKVREDARHWAREGKGRRCRAVEMGGGDDGEGSSGSGTRIKGTRRNNTTERMLVTEDGNCF
jgi:hypothetical protein